MYCVLVIETCSIVRGCIKALKVKKGRKHIGSLFQIQVIMRPVRYIASRAYGTIKSSDIIKLES